MKKTFFFSLALLFLLPGCAGKPPEVFNRTTFAMDTVMTLSAYGDKGEAAVEDAIAEINRLEKALSVTLPDSDVSAINGSNGKAVEVGDDAAALLRSAQELGASTGGALDVTLYPVVRAWGFTTEEAHIPDAALVEDLLTRVDYSAPKLDGNTVTLPAGMALDFGALAKGYTGEKCAALMKEQGVTSALLSLGGNVQTVGAKPDGSPWRVGVQGPSGQTEDYAGVLEIVDQAAVTSGGYQRYFEEDGVRYWHIIDPATGAPARSGLVSATIVGDSGTLCDGLSTALFVMGREKALDYWKEVGGFEAVLIDEDNTVWVTGGLADRFTLADEEKYTLCIVEDET